MDFNKFYKINLNYYNNLLKKKKLDEYEIKYQKLISNYSPAYLSGSEWYVGPSLIEYLHKESIYKIIPIKLKIICKILDNF